MNHRRILTLSGFGLAIFLTIVFLRPNPTPTHNGKNPFTADETIGSAAAHLWSSEEGEGNPEARRSWDLMRLADPATGKIPPHIHRLEQEFARRLPSRRTSALVEALGGDSTAKTRTWRFRGPNNLGGRTRALAVDVGDPTYQTLLAGGVSGGMWRSTNDGASWTLTTGSSQLQSVTSVAQDTRAGHRNVWYYGTGEYRGNSAGGGGGAAYRGDGLFRSDDGGLTWAQLPFTAGANPATFSSYWQYVARVVTDPSNLAEDELYAAVYGRIMRSVDGGASFQSVKVSNGSQYTDVVVSATGVVFASLSADGGLQPGIFRSPDGIAWTNITPPTLPGNFRRIVLGLSPSDENILYCLADMASSPTDTRFFKYTYLSGDGSGAGGLWEDRSAQMAGLANGPLHTQGSYNMAITVHPTDPNTVYLGGRALYRSTDGFATPGSIVHIGGRSYDGHHTDQHWLLFEPGSANVAYTGSDGGVHRTLDAKAGSVVWTALNNGYTTSQFYTVAIDEDEPGSSTVIGGTQDNGSKFTNSDSPADNWLDHVGADGGYCAVANRTSAVDTLLYSWQNGVMVRLRVDHYTGDWISGTQFHPTDAGDYLFINPYIMDPMDHKMVYTATSNGVWRNNDYTVVPDWTGGPVMINWDHLTTVPAGEYVSALAMSRSSARILYYGTAMGKVYRLDNAATAPPGSAPTQLGMGTDFALGSYVTSIAIDPDDDQKVLLGVSNYNVPSLFFSEDGGATWSTVEGNLSGTNGPSIRSVAILPIDALYPPGQVNDEVFLVGTSTGLYIAMELDGVATEWHLESPDQIGNVVVDFLATRASDGTVAAATHGKGIYSFSAAEVTAVDEGKLPRVTRLAQNVPNPFNPSTTISFTMPEAATVSLRIYDLSGRLVRVLLNAEEVAAGRREAVWRGRDDTGRAVAAGVYLYRLDAGGISETKRMLLVK